MNYILTLEEIKCVEQLSDKNGLSYIRLMENAGTACAKVIRQEFDETLKRDVFVICGKGKNGGDGFVIARKLYENGYKVSVLLALGAPKAEDAAEMFSRLDDLDIPVYEYLTDSKRSKDKIENCDVIVDCIFGTGFSSEPDEILTELFTSINNSKAYTVSVDLPSGFYTDSSELCSCTVEPDMTVSVIALKHSLVFAPSCFKAGKVKCVSIGVPEAIMNDICAPFSLDERDVKNVFPKRKEDSHKGDYGKALIIAGSYEMPGAALLASKSCVNAGAGLVELAFPDKAYTAVTADCPEKTLAVLPSDENGCISASSIKRISAELEKCDAVLIGCGLGAGRDISVITEFVLANSKVPVILDADALNSISKRADIINEAEVPVIITPHSGEAARLLKTTPEKIEKDRMKAVNELAELTGATVLLKGFRTIVKHRDGDAYINLTGNSALSTAGSGDVLAGLICSLICQGVPPYRAACCAAFLHGRAGEAAARKYSKAGTTASDLIEQIKNIMKIAE